MNEIVENKAKELYKSGLTDAQYIFTSFDGLDDEQKENWFRCARYVLASEIKARIYELNEYGKFDKESHKRIIKLESQLRELEMNQNEPRP